MNRILSNYFTLFFHPFKVQADLKKQREQQTAPTLSLVSEQSLNPALLPTTINFSEILCISWLMNLIKAFYGILALYLGINSAQFISDRESTISANLINNQVETQQQWVIFSLILGAILFPLVLWFYSKFWVGIIQFFCKIFGREEYNEQATTLVVNYAFSSYTFLLIPVFGPVIQNISFLIYLYAGLRNNLSFSFMQSVTILATPIFLLFFVLLMTFMMFLITAMAIFPSLSF